jgi:putative heme-binding domain-containing protein
MHAIWALDAATAMGRMGDELSMGVLQEMLKDADGHVRFAAWTALNQMGRRDGKHWPQIVWTLGVKDARVREGAGYALRETYEMKAVEALEGLARSGDWAAPPERADALRILASLCRKHPQWKGEWWAYHPALAPAPERIMDWEGTPVVLKTLRERLDDAEPAVRRAAVEGIGLVKDSPSAGLLGKLFGVERDAENRRAIVRALGMLKQPASVPLLIEVLKDYGEDRQLLAAAVEAAAEFSAVDLADALSRQLPDRSADISIGVVRALGKISGEGVTQTIAGALQDTRVEVRREAARVLGDRRAAGAVPELLAVVDDQQMGSAAMSALAKIGDARALDVYLRALAGKDVALREQARGAIGRIGETVLATLELRVNHLAPQVVGELQKALANNERARNGPIFAVKVKVIEAGEYQAFARKNLGDAGRGRKLFEDEAGMGCLRCHSVGGKGGSIGPDLSASGSQFSREVLIESILQPSKSIREGYQVYTVKTKRGDWFDGLHKGENHANVMLLDSAGTLHSIPKADIASQRASSISLMPEGLQSALTLEEFADLIAYLQSLRSQGRAR